MESEDPHKQGADSPGESLIGAQVQSEDNLKLKAQDNIQGKHHAYQYPYLESNFMPIFPCDDNNVIDYNNSNHVIPDILKEELKVQDYI